MTAPARTAAYHALRAVAANREDLPTALARSRTHLDDDRDRGLAAEIVTGTGVPPVQHAKGRPTPA